MKVRTNQNNLLHGMNPPSNSDKIGFYDAAVYAGRNVYFPKGALIVDKSGSIVDLGTSDSLQKKHPDISWHDASSFIITPGLINAHTHCSLSFFRGLGQVAVTDPKLSMIETVLFPAEKSLTEDLVAPLAYSYILDGLRSGVTCFGDHYYFIKAVGQALESFGVRGCIGETVADLGGAFPSSQIWTKVRASIDSWSFSDRIRPVIAPHAADTVSRGLLKDMGAYALKNQIPLHMHLAQTRGERERCLKREKVSPVRLAYECEALSPHSLAVHLLAVDEEDLKLLKASGCTIGFCPSSQIFYEHLAPIEKFLSHQIPIAAATDCAASNDAANVLAEARVAALMALDRGRKSVPTEDVFDWVTSIPAQVFGMSHLGTLGVKKAADLVFWDKDIALEPLVMPQNIIFSMSSRHVTHVMVDGRFVLWNRNPCLIDLGRLSEDYRTAVGEINRRIGRSPLS